MPEKKNQHFVPRCGLKPFTLDGAGLAINLFNISRARAIQNAPVKSQCARDYLYGKGEKSAEGLLAQLEGEYARVNASLIKGGDLSGGDEKLLRLFVGIKQRRTQSAIDQMRELTKSMADKIFARAPEYRPEDQSDAVIMLQSLAIAMQFLKYTGDLKLCILANKTKIDLVTCDHPAVLTNRFHFQRLQKNTFGISNSGAIILMPLSPRLSLTLYDQQVYTLPNATGQPFVDLTRDDDVHALNQVQYLSAANNVYFRDWNDAERITSEVVALAEIRAAAVSVSKMLVRDYNDHGADEVYRTGSAEEEVTAREAIVMTAFRQPEPVSWLSLLKFRSKIKTFSNGSAVGHVRKVEWLSGERR
jgi:uncharacterized protein DUF4238